MKTISPVILALFIPIACDKPQADDPADVIMGEWTITSWSFYWGDFRAPDSSSSQIAEFAGITPTFTFTPAGEYIADYTPSFVDTTEWSKTGNGIIIYSNAGPQAFEILEVSDGFELVRPLNPEEDCQKFTPCDWRYVGTRYRQHD